MSDHGAVFPFCAIVGQETLKRALLLNAVDPSVGGVLVRGEKGTAKSTAVRALAAVLPPLSVNEGCRFSCDPASPRSWCDECRSRRTDGPLPKARRDARIVELPISATEDRLVGTLDLEHALKRGEKVFEPGLLARANRSILYVDEVNLLDDHLVDTLLDAAAMGVNTVEREGVSFRHPARFMLVGTMNPEEGELRPQLLDRFGLCVDIVAERDPAARVEIMRRRRDFESDPESFAQRFADEQASLASRIRSARLALEAMDIPDALLYSIANLALTVGVDGHRADSAMARAALANAALEGRTEPTERDLALVAPLVLAHRMRRTLFDEPRLDATALASLVSSTLLAGRDPEDEPGSDGTASQSDGQAPLWASLGTSEEAPVGVPRQAPSFSERTAPDSVRRTTAGRRSPSLSDDSRGRYRSAEIPRGESIAASELALDASVRAAAPHQAERGSGDLAIRIDHADIRSKVRVRSVGATVVFCVDTSGSMGSEGRVDATRSAVLDLLGDAYVRRDRVGVVAFRGDSARVVLAPTASVELAALRLRSLPTGGATPLAAGILTSLDVLAQELRREPDTVPWLVIVTDARANVGVDNGVGSADALRAARQIAQKGVACVVVDVGAGGAHGRELAAAAGARYLKVGGERLASELRSLVTGA